MRDRFPGNVVYEFGRLHIDLSTIAPIEGVVSKKLAVGHVDLQILKYLNIHDVDIRKGAMVMRYRFEKDRLLQMLRDPAPEGFYKIAPSSTAPQQPQRLLPPPSERVQPSRAERAFKIGSSIAGRGVSLIRRVRKNR